MPDISKIKLENDIYNIKDATARADLETLESSVQSIETITQAEVDQITSDAFDSFPSPVYGYDTVADMQADPDLQEGMICHTNGFHAAGDGGAAYYKISNSGTANGMNVLVCGDLFATLIITEPYVTPEQFGAWGDGTHDDSAAFTQMMERVHAKSITDIKNNITNREILLCKSYNVGTLSIPNYYYHKLVFRGGAIHGGLSFGANTFYHLTFEGVNFYPTSGFAVEVAPLMTIEYKTINFKNCCFIGGNGVYANTRSLLSNFDTCTFQSCDLAFRGLNMDKCNFNNCWFDTKANKSASEYPYTVLIDGTLESACTFNNCIVVNATTNKGEYGHTAFIGTVGVVAFSGTRISNEGATTFYVCEFMADTPAVLSTNHVTGVSFVGCDISTTGVVYLLGIPSFITISGCGGQPSGNKLIQINSSLTDVYKIRPQLSITIDGDSFQAFNIVRLYGSDANTVGLSLPANLIPTVPFELYYAVNRGHRAQNAPFIVPLTGGLKYNIAANTPTQLFKLVVKGTTYNDMYLNGKAFWVKYTMQTPNQTVFATAMDIVNLDRTSDGIVAIKTNLFGGREDVTYAVTYDSDAKEYTVSITSATKILDAIDYGIFDGGFATI